MTCHHPGPTGQHGVIQAPVQSRQSLAFGESPLLEVQGRWQVDCAGYVPWPGIYRLRSPCVPIARPDIDNLPPAQIIGCDNTCICASGGVVGWCGFHPPDFKRLSGAFPRIQTAVEQAHAIVADRGQHPPHSSGHHARHIVVDHHRIGRQESKPPQRCSKIGEVWQRVAGARWWPAEIGIEIDKDGTGNVAFFVRPQSMARLPELPTDVVDTNRFQVGPQLIRGDQVGHHHGLDGFRRVRATVPNIGASQQHEFELANPCLTTWLDRRPRELDGPILMRSFYRLFGWGAFWFALAAMVFLVAQSNLPETVAIHWNGAGVADGSAGKVLLLLAPAAALLIGLLIALPFRIGGEPTMESFALVGMTGGLGLSVVAMTATANWGISDWRDAGELTLWSFLLLFGFPILGLAIGIFVGRAWYPLKEIAPTEEPAIDISPGERVSWVGRARVKWVALVTFGVAVLLVVTIPDLPLWVFLPLVGLGLVLSQVEANVTNDGMRIRLGGILSGLIGLAGFQAQESSIWIHCSGVGGDGVSCRIAQASS